MVLQSLLLHVIVTCAFLGKKELCVLKIVAINFRELQYVVFC